MLGVGLGEFHLSPAEFWGMTTREFWAAAKYLNPEIVLSANKKFFDDEEQEIINRIKQEMNGK